MKGQTSRSRAYHNGPTRHADHFVYRCYDAAGRLLYIGCTSNVARRMSDHRSSPNKASRWLRVSMASFTVEGPFPSRTAGLAAEASAIQAEQPLFNLQERANERQAARMTRPAVAEYLVSIGQRALAIETACSCWRETRETGGVDSWCRAHDAEPLTLTG